MRKLSLIVASCFLLTAAVAEENEQSEHISNTRSASCLVKVKCDPQILPLSFEAVESLVHSSGVGGKAVREQLERPPEEAPDLIDIRPLAPYREPYSPSHEQKVETAKPCIPPGAAPTAEQSLLFCLEVAFGEDVKPAAQECMKAVIENLRDSLHHVFKEHTFHLENQLSRAEGLVQGAQDKHVRIRETLPPAVVAKHEVLKEIQRLRKDIAEYKMREALMSAHSEAIAKQIAEIEEKVHAKLANDPITAELRRIVELRDKALESARQLVKDGRAPSTAVEEAIQKLLQARTELSNQRDRVSHSVGAGHIKRLTERLADISVEVAERRVRLEELERQLHEAENLLDIAERFELTSMKADLARENLERAIRLRDQMQRKVSLLYPPTVTVLGAD
jgi:flagellar biosynthesis chaperone FliJ